MKQRIEATVYPPLEEKLNVLTHGIGWLLSIWGLVMLVIKASVYGNAWHIVSFSVYGVSMVTLYAASTLYHAAKDTDRRYRRNIFDHSSIYLLIAGTYTPFVLVTLNGALGWVIFGIIWGLAVGGIVFKIFFIGRFNLLSTIMYVVMGWIIVIGIRSIIETLPTPGLWLLLSGGISYTVGAVLFSIEKIPMNHALFHLFVLGGTVCHYLSIYYYVLSV